MGGERGVHTYRNAPLIVFVKEMYRDEKDFGNWCRRTNWF